MIDRNSQNPGRRKLILEGLGTVNTPEQLLDFFKNGAGFYSVISRADNPLLGYEGTPLQMSTLFDNTNRLLYNLSEPNATPNQAFRRLAKGFYWQQLQSYTTAGTYTWTVSDIYGDGQPYEIGVFEVGGGGSGGVIHFSNATTTNLSAGASGGGSGYSRTFYMMVTPGQNIAVVVGTGGAAVSRTYAGSTLGVSAGQNGNSSSFAAVSVDGGQGGPVRQNTASGNWLGATGANGAQGADAVSHYGGDTPASAPGGGRNTFASLGLPATGSGSNLLARGGFVYPNQCMNPFTGDTLLSAGGSTFIIPPSGVNAYVIQTAAPNISGSSPSVVTTTTGTAPNVKAPDATGNGNGGGAAGINSPGGSPTVTSGAGAAGMVKVYIRRTRV